MAQVRKIKGLKAASFADKAPFSKPRRLKGSKAAGIAYERKFHKAIPALVRGTRFVEHKVWAGEWIKFVDSNGEGHAQPDFFLVPPQGVGEGLILETKLSLNTRGWFQLEKLYLPLLEWLYPDVEWKMVQVCKNMRPGYDRYPVLDIYEPLKAELGVLSIWHCFNV